MHRKAVVGHRPSWSGSLPQLSREQMAMGGLVVIVAASVGIAKAAPYLPEALSRVFEWMGLSLGAKDSIRLGPMRLTDDSRTMPTQIMGTTGSGKTVCMEHILFGDLARGRGALIIDPKGERQFYERVRSFCTQVGRAQDLFLLSATYPEESVIWNPCGLGNASELQTKFFNSAIYSEPHYAKACEAALLKAFEELVRINPDGFSIEHLADELERISKETKEKNIEGLFYDLYNLSHGEWRTVLGGKSSGKREPVSLLDVVQQGKILFVDLPTEGKLVQSSRIGWLLTQEIILLSGLRKRSPELKSAGRFSVFIDEFDAFGTESFISFLNKGRSSGFLVTLAHQTLSDLAKVGPTFEGQVTGNINTQIVFRLNSADDCEKLSRSFGTKTVTRSTYQTDNGMATGAASKREAQEFRVHPDEIKRLKTGRCVFVMKDRGIVRKIRVPRPLVLKTSEERIYTKVVQRGLGVRRPRETETYANETPARSQMVADILSVAKLPTTPEKAE